MWRWYFDCLQPVFVSRIHDESVREGMGHFEATLWSNACNWLWKWIKKIDTKRHDNFHLTMQACICILMWLCVHVCVCVCSNNSFMLHNVDVLYNGAVAGCCCQRQCQRLGQLAQKKSTTSRWRWKQWTNAPHYGEAQKQAHKSSGNIIRLAATVRF